MTLLEYIKRDFCHRQAKSSLNKKLLGIKSLRDKKIKLSEEKLNNLKLSTKILNLRKRLCEFMINTKLSKDFESKNHFQKLKTQKRASSTYTILQSTA